MELDHVFLFVPDERTALSMMESAGLRVNYSRRHPGQGTQNVCACLDDMFLELLWLDGSEISRESQRVGLGLRGRGHGSPIGVSWRGPTALECVPYAAPFLPNGLSISIARASLDSAMPFLFETPGGTPPIDMTDGLPGERQRPQFTRLGTCEIRVPNPAAVADLLGAFDRVVVTEGAPGLTVTLLDQNGRVADKVDWTAPKPL